MVLVPLEHHWNIFLKIHNFCYKNTYNLEKGKSKYVASNWYDYKHIIEYFKPQIISVLHQKILNPIGRAVTNQKFLILCMHIIFACVTFCTLCGTYFNARNAPKTEIKMILILGYSLSF